MSHLESNSSALKVTQLNKSFGLNCVLQSINWEVQAGQCHILIGRSGGGKSTLLRCIKGLEFYDKGDITWGNLNLPAVTNKKELKSFQKIVPLWHKRVGMVFQNYNLFPHLNLMNNLLLAPLKTGALTIDVAHERALNLLNKVGLAKWGQHFPHQLSGGQQQRGAIARSLMMQPEVLLYDEPTSALDPNLAEEVWVVMRQLQHEGMTQIVCTHALTFASAIADQILFLEDGKILEQGRPEKILQDPNYDSTKKFVSGFLKKTIGTPS